MDIMICLISKGHYCFPSGGLYPAQGITDCSLALYFNGDNAIKSHCSIHSIPKNTISQLSPKHHLMPVIKSSSIDYGCPGRTYIKAIKPPLDVITISE